MHSHLSIALRLLGIISRSSIYWLVILASLATLSTIATATDSTTAANNTDPRLILLDENDLLVVEASIEQLLLDESLFVFQTPETTLIPLQGLIDVLDFPLEIDLDTRTIDGWFIEESNRISIDLYKQNIFLRGKKQSWPKSLRYATDDFDLYLDYQSIESWFGLTLNLDVSQLTLKIDSATPLPIIQRLKREAKRKKISQQAAPSFPSRFIQNQYDWLGHPVFDVELSYDLEHDTSDETRTNTSQFASAVVQGSMDVVKHSMSTSYINNDGEADLRVTLTRAAKGPDETMFLGLNKYSVGDITSESNALLFGSVKGSGTHLKRGGTSILDQSDDILIEGDAPPGWEVELYRNGNLVEFSEASRDGRYSFANIPTFVGENIFDIRIYGPQGQYRTDRKEITVGSGMIKTGEWEYQLYAINKNKNLIASELNSNEPESDFFLSEASYGINEHVTVQAGLNHMTLANASEASNYQYLNLFGSLFGNLAQLRFARDIKGGSAVSSAIKGRLYETNFNLELTKFNSLISERNPDGQFNINAKIRANGVTRFFTPSPLSYDVELERIQYKASSQKQWVFSKRLSSNWGQTLLAHDFRFSQTNLDDTEDQLSSKLSATRRLHHWRLKAEIDYEIEPAGKFQGVSTSATFQRSKALIYQGTLDYRSDNNDEISLNNTLTWNFNPASLSLSAGFSTEDRQSLGISLNTSLGYDPVRSRYLITKESLSNSASVTARAFIDNNNNGTFDNDEQPIENLSFKGKSSWRDAQTDAEGYTTLTGIPNLEMQGIEIDQSSIEDPFLRPRQEQQFIYTHAAKHTELSFALVPTLEVEGSLFIRRAESNLLAKDVQLYLVDTHQNIIATTRSEYDGVFIFDKVLPGSYFLEIDRAYLAKNRVSNLPKIRVETRNSDGVIYLESIILQSR